MPPEASGPRARCAEALRSARSHPWTARELVALCVPSCLLATSLVVGPHIHVEDGYLGLASQNYLTPFGLADLLLLPALAGGISALACLAWARWGAVAREGERRGPSFDMGPVGRGRVVRVGAALCACWLPYLLTYFPGIMFPDSVQSLCQALGWLPFNNHHPVPYTLFIRLCLVLGAAFGGGYQAGVALYSVTQMALLALSVSYLLCWVARRLRLPGRALAVMAAGFCLSRYLAEFSICMWKDPLFCAAWVVVSCQLADLALTRGAVARDRRWLGSLALSSLVATLWRNNGYLVMALVVVCAAAPALRGRRARTACREGSPAVAVMALSVALAMVVNGPAYRLLGVETEPVEALGVPLNQMARVAALGGNVPEGDAAYLNALLPMGLYATTYRPCCVDRLKWAPEFDATKLTGEFFAHWASLLVRNPARFAEAWVMQTHGFWTLNCPHIVTCDWNVSQGAPVNAGGGQERFLDGMHITCQNLLGEWAERAFPLPTWSIPEGWLLWAVVYVAVALWLGGQRALALSLLPSLGVALTLLLASPIWYWPRYGALLQLLIPLYAALGRASSGTARRKARRG